MAGNKVVLEFAGDATKLAKEEQKASKAVDDFSKSSKNANKDLGETSKTSDKFLDKIGKLGGAVSGASNAIGDASAALDSFNDIQNASYEQAQKTQRALVDVRQAQEDLSQALRDSRQAAIDSDQAQVDLTQAHLDQRTALQQLKSDIKEYGKNSAQAAQDQIDLKQAGVDVKQAQEDQAQSTRDASQANIDAKSAQLDLNDAQKEAHPPDTQKWANDVQMYLPILSGLVGVTGLVTAAQWAWNAAQLASPTTWIILGIVALVAIIILIAKKTTWFQDIWRASWKWIKSAASDTWNFLKKIPGWLGSAFKGIANILTWPFRTAFNLIASAWNSTIGSLHWTVPNWIPGVGGNSISVPKIPKFHSGIDSVPGAPGSEMLAVLQAGERVTPAGHSDGFLIEIKSGGTQMDDLLVEVLSKAIRGRGGNVQKVLGGRNA